MFSKTKRLIVQLSDIKKNPSEEVLSLIRRPLLFTELFGEPKVILKRCQMQEEVEDPVYVKKNRYKNLESDEEVEDKFDVRQKVKKVFRVLESDEEEEEEDQINIRKQVSRSVKSNEEYMPENESEGDSSSDEEVKLNFAIESENTDSAVSVVDSEPDHQTPIYSFSYMERRDWRERITEVDSEENCETTESSLSDEDFELRSETIEHSSSSDEEKQEDEENSEDDEDSHSGSVIKSSYEKMIEEKQAKRIAFLKALKIDEVKAGYHEAVIERKEKRPFVRKQYTKFENGSVLLRKSSRLANSGVSINFSEKALFAKIMNVTEKKQLSVYKKKYKSGSESSEDSLDDIIFQDESSSASTSSGDSMHSILSQGQTDFRKLTDVLKERIKPIERTFKSSRLRSNCAANSTNFNEKYLYLKSVIETLEVKEVEDKKVQLKKDEKKRRNIIKNSKSRSSERVKKSKC